MPRALSRWTPEEDEILRREAQAQLQEGGIKCWNRIATKLPGRSNKDCRKRWCNEVTGGLKKGWWDPEEDRRLQKGIQEFGQRWAVIAPIVKTRSADQCAKRWKHSLDPELNHSEWTAKEDLYLLRAVQTHQRSWKDIQRLHYPDRSRNDIKNRYTIRSRRPESTPLSTDLLPCCKNTSARSTSPEVDDITISSSAEDMNFADQDDLSQYREDHQGSGQVAQRLSCDQLDAVPKRFQRHPSYDKHTNSPDELTSSPSYLGDFSTIVPACPNNRSTGGNDAPVSLLDTGDLNVGLSFDQEMSFSDGWQTEANGLEHCPLSSLDFANNVTALDNLDAESQSIFSETTWTTPAEHHTLIPDTDIPFPQTSVESSAGDQGNRGRVRLIMESPTVDVSKAVVEAVLSAPGEMSLEADEFSRVALTLENVTGTTLQTVLHILFESKTKIQMQTN